MYVSERVLCMYVSERESLLCMYVSERVLCMYVSEINSEHLLCMYVIIYIYIYLFISIFKTLTLTGSVQRTPRFATLCPWENMFLQTRGI